RLRDPVLRQTEPAGEGTRQGGAGDGRERRAVRGTVQQGMSSPPAGEDLIRVDDLVKSFGSTQAVRGASFGIATGEIHALCGHNGAGKSTVVKMLSGQEAPDGGAIRI